MTLNVFIHIGPPKTATSAIQNWMQENSTILLERGIYYPPHAVDENGVSSGNVLNLYDRDQDKRLTLSEKKFNALISEAQNLCCSKLVLSSEFFFLEVDNLIEIFPNAKIITYIRFPLDVVESSYNQGVKRHQQTKPLGIAKEPNAYHLAVLEKYLERLGTTHFTMRFFSKSLFRGGNIVSDFLSQIGEDDINAEDKNINLSYAFEALEFKRWANCFASLKNQRRIDQLMQSYKSENAKYTLISDKDYSYYTDWYTNKLVQFFEKFPVENSQQFLKEIQHRDRPPYLKQSLKIEDFRKVLDFISEKEPPLVYALADEACQSELAKSKRSDFVDEIKARLPITFKVKTAFVKYKTEYLRGIKRLTTGKRTASLPTSVKVAPVFNTKRLREHLSIPDSIPEAVIYRELALHCEQNGELELAYRLMSTAKKHSPSGPFINQKVEQYRVDLNIEKTDL